MYKWFTSVSGESSSGQLYYLNYVLGMNLEFNKWLWKLLMTIRNRILSVIGTLIWILGCTKMQCVYQVSLKRPNIGLKDRNSDVPEIYFRTKGYSHFRFLWNTYNQYVYYARVIKHTITFYVREIGIFR